jgi:selenocysteine lyase/cysteine desulfurase
MKLTCKRNKFTLPPQVAYLNGGYMSPLLKTAEKVGVNALRRKRNPVHIAPADFFSDCNEVKKSFARLIHAPDPERIAIIPSASYGLANAANNMPISKGQHILVASEQFPSNYYPWKRLCDDRGAEVRTIFPPEGMDQRGKRWNERLLNAINHNTYAVAIGNIHWADGTLFQLEAIRQRTREVGALLIVDGTQSVGALPFDVQRIQPDALVCAAYKWLLGPYSIGLAYYGGFFDRGKPIEENWANRLHSENFAALVNYQHEYQPGAQRYDMGERCNFTSVPMLIASLKQLHQWGPAHIQSYSRQLTEPHIARLRESGFLIDELPWRSSHLFGIRLPEGYSMDKIKERLLKQKVYVSYRGNAIRVSAHVYNRDQDFERLTKGLVKSR